MMFAACRRGGRLLLSTSTISSVIVLNSLSKNNLQATKTSVVCKRLMCDASSAPSGNSDIILYQFMICPYCNKVKALLDYMKVDYETVEVDPLTKSEISFSKDYKKVPIASIKGKQVNGSEEIMKQLLSGNVIKIDEKKKAAFFTADSDKWSEWSEKKLAIMLYPNITRSYNDSFDALAYVEDITKWNYLHRMSIRYLGALFMPLGNTKLKAKYNIVDERKELKEVLLTWCDAIKGKKFLHGDAVSFPDVLVYGVLRSICKTAIFDEIMKDAQYAALGAWYRSVDSEMSGKRSGL